MQTLLAGLHRFQSDVFGHMKEFFQGLSHGQKPEALFITCSDSRVNPNLITQTRPGELFILRNAGNIVPPYGSAPSGEAATIEFAVGGLGIRHVIICGHSHCGAMSGLIDPESIRDFPSVRAWLTHAEGTRRIMEEKYAERTGNARLTTAVQENVLMQLENLKTHPVIATGLANNQLKLHGWVYKFETGEVFEYDPSCEQFVKLTPPVAAAEATDAASFTGVATEEQNRQAQSSALPAMKK
ncbi:MAG: carbonic anhydrase [Aureliella sp.]